MKVTKIGTINNGIDGLEHYFNIVADTDETKESVFEELQRTHYYAPSDTPGKKFIDRMHLVEAGYYKYIFIIIEKYDV